MSTANEVKMFGTSLAEVQAAFDNRLGPPEMYVASVLSDIQEVLARGNGEETARQWLNVAKHCLFKMLEAKMPAGTDAADLFKKGDGRSASPA
jgi:hypothetical protein